MKNIFFEDNQEFTLDDYMCYGKDGRGNLGDHISIATYRLLEYSLKIELMEQFGKDVQIDIFRKAGYRSGVYFASHILDLHLPFHEFVAQLQKELKHLKIGILRIEDYDEKTGKIVLTVSEDADCSGLPFIGETVCNYDEGFFSGVLSKYTGKSYSVIEVDCWATGDRVCRFQAMVEEITNHE